MKKQKAVIVLPTYNERENIELLINLLAKQRRMISDFELKILIVDDNSPDGTADVVRDLQKIYPFLYIIPGKKRGLGVAYKRGFDCAVKVLKADVVIQMDADLSHDPKHIKSFLNHIKEGYDFVIGSRHIAGGSLPDGWPLIRKINTKIANFIARVSLGIRGVSDVTSGYRAIRVDLLKKLSLNNILKKSSGYAVMINLVYQAHKHNALIYEEPISFQERKHGSSKIRIRDISEFLAFCLSTRLASLVDSFSLVYLSLLIAFTLFVLLLADIYQTNGIVASYTTGISLILLLQGLFTLYWMTFAWDDPKNTSINRASKSIIKSKRSFTALVAALNEEGVIGKTIEAIDSIKYPDHLKELFVIIPSHDYKTLNAARKVKEQIGKDNINIIADTRSPKNKPYQLNHGLTLSTKDVVAIFDAEDEPSKDIYNIVNAVMEKDKSDVVQSGVQLINYRSTWFSTLNVLEYYLWFKSALHVFANKGVVFLGGNTVFFKKEWLEKVKGWDDSCLTEDADIGLKLSLAGAKFSIVYDENHATLEETPLDIHTFIKQRTRWIMGFLQILLKGEWRELPSLKQRFFAVYVLLVQPLLGFFLLLNTLFSVFSLFIVQLPVQYALLSIMPLFVLIMIIATSIVALYDFSKLYEMKYPFWMPLKVVVTFIPYSLILFYSSFRAIYRLLVKKVNWEKTVHVGVHREFATSVLNDTYE